MQPKPLTFSLVYYDFERFEFDPTESQQVLEERGFDLAYARRVFPGYVLERQDTRFYSETRFQVIGEVLGGNNGR